MFRALVAAVMVGAGWLTIIWLADNHHPGAWFLFPLLLWVLFGPTLVAYCMATRMSRARSMLRIGLAAATIPAIVYVLVFVFALRTEESEPSLLPLLAVIATIGALGATTVWGTSAVAGALKADD